MEDKYLVHHLIFNPGSESNPRSENSIKYLCFKQHQDGLLKTNPEDDQISIEIDRSEFLIKNSLLYLQSLNESHWETSLH